MKYSTRHLHTDNAALREAAGLLCAGELVAFPTETVYGLGADATNGRAVAAIYQAKGRPGFNPLIAHVASIEAALVQGIFSPAAHKLAAAFWPGPMTLVVPRAASCTVSEIATAGLDSLALRIPAHPVAHALLELAARPVAAPSANRSGHVSATTPAHVCADLDGRIAAIVDGGPTDVGVESTILCCLGEEVAMLRPGGLPRERIEQVLGCALAESPQAGQGGSDAPLAPGMLTSHYAPQARVRLDAVSVASNEAWLGFGGAGKAGTGAVELDLSPSGDLVEAAANLFGMLRALDRPGIAAIAVAAIPAHGLGEAIRDRLSRAAAGR